MKCLVSRSLFVCHASIPFFFTAGFDNCGFNILSEDGDGFFQNDFFFFASFFCYKPGGKWWSKKEYLRTKSNQSNVSTRDV